MRNTDIQVFKNRDKETEVSTPHSREAKHNAKQNSLTCMNKMGRRGTQLVLPKQNTREETACACSGGDSIVSVSSARSCLGRLPGLLSTSRKR